MQGKATRISQPTIVAQIDRPFLRVVRVCACAYNHDRSIQSCSIQKTSSYLKIVRREVLGDGADLLVAMRVVGRGDFSGAGAVLQAFDVGSAEGCDREGVPWPTEASISSDLRMKDGREGSYSP